MGARQTRSKPLETATTNMVKNVLIVWLDANIDLRNDDCKNTLTSLHELSTSVETFTDVNECVRFIAEIHEKEAFMIFSGSLGENTVPQIHEMVQVRAIYIFCGDVNRHEQWTKQWPKIQGVFKDFNPLLGNLNKVIQGCDQKAISMSSTIKSDGVMKEDCNQLDTSFMYTQILKDILLTIDYRPQQFMEFINYCREQFQDNSIELINVKKFEKEYRSHTSIWWYTYDCFLHSMLNNALNTMDMDVTVRMGFFIRDLHEHIVHLHSEQRDKQQHTKPFIVYHKQSYSQVHFDKLMQMQNYLLAFNSFLLTSKIPSVPRNPGRQTAVDLDMVDILFVMKIDPSICSIPFANVRAVSYHQNDEEILFSMHTVFRVEQIQKIDENNRLWQVNLTLTNDSDRQLYALTECLREEVCVHESGWPRLANLLLGLGQFNKAQEIYETMSNQTTDDRKKADIYDQLGRIKHGTGENQEAIIFYEKAMKIKQKILPTNHPDLAASYNNLGLVYDTMNEYSKALLYYEKVLEIHQKSLPPSHPNLATSYSNIGSVYENMSEYSKALSFYEKALHIFQKSLPPNHPNLATSYSNIGSVYQKMKEYSKALLYYERALNIGQQSLPPNHSQLQSYRHIIEALKKKK